jgi:hypothetical protein
LGKDPLDATYDERIATIYLACHAMAPTGPEAFAEPLAQLEDELHPVFRNDLATRLPGLP